MLYEDSLCILYIGVDDIIHKDILSLFEVSKITIYVSPFIINSHYN
jgi:hypothetical protein